MIAGGVTENLAWCVTAPAKIMNMPTVLHRFESKALPLGSVNELKSGDLLLAGWAVVFEGLDADNENFLAGALGDNTKGAIADFLSTNALLAVHHDVGKALGRVLTMTPTEKGVKFTARVDKQLPSSPLFHVYEAVRRGTISSASLGGYFSRGATSLGQMISRVLRITELSVTGGSKHPLTRFSAAEVKSLGLDGDDQRALAVAAGRDLQWALARLSAEAVIARSLRL
jgi:phage head maturation protease